MLKSCAVAPSGSNFAMTTSRWLPVLALSYFRQQVERVRTVSSSEKVTPSKSSQFFLSTCCRKYDKANSGNQRLVVMAKLLPEGATEQAFTVKLVKKPEMP